MVTIKNKCFNLSLLLLTTLFVTSLIFTNKSSYSSENKLGELSDLEKIYIIENAHERLSKLMKVYENENNERQFSMLPLIIKTFYEIGDYDSANKYSKHLINISDKHKDNWVYGNAIHDANMVLGLTNLKDGNISLAIEYLLKAGDTPGSYLIRHVGPNMLLAKALLKHNQRDAVIEYLKKIEKLWLVRNDQLSVWIEEVQSGLIPDFGANLELNY